MTRISRVGLVEPLQPIQPSVQALGENELNIGHTGSRRRQHEGLLDHLAPIDRAAWDAAFNWRVDGEDGSDEQ